MAKFEFDFSNSHSADGHLIGYGRFVDGKLTLVWQHEAGATKPKVRSISQGPIAPIKWDFPDIPLSVFNEILLAFFVADPHIATASPKRWHVRQKRASCLRLKARDA